jgi:DNA-binding NarL/FixJ family response regulator
MIQVSVLLPDELHARLSAQGLLASDVVRDLLCAELERRTANGGTGEPSAAPDHPVNPGLALVTPAEWRVLDFLATHLTLAEIAARLFVSRATVKSHVASVYHKLQVSRRAEVVAVLLAAAERADLRRAPDRPRLVG